jgi:hypothetical protein
LCLETGRITHNEAGHGDGCGRGPNRPTPPKLSEEREPTGVIEVAMGEEHSVEFFVGSYGRTIEGFGFLSSLEKSAIH